MAVVIQCDRDGCPSQGREDTLTGWVTVHPMGGEVGEALEFCSSTCERMHLDGETAWPADRIPSDGDLEYARQILAAVPNCAWTGVSGDGYCIARVAQHGDICRDHQQVEVPETIHHD